MKKTIVAVFVMFLGAQSHAAIITNVAKTGGSAEVPVVTPLLEGTAAFTDRTHALVNVPTEFEDAELIQLSNDDKSSDPLQHDVTIGNLAVLYVGLDDRINDGKGQPLPWMADPGMTGLPTAFFDTGRQIDIDEGANGSIENTFSLWATIAPAGTYSLFEQTDGGSRNMYIAFADNKLISIPEPTSLSLIAIGICGMVSLMRRR